MVNLENVYTRTVIQSRLYAMLYVYTYTYTYITTIIDKRGHEFIKEQEGYMGGFRESKVKEKQY